MYLKSWHIDKGRCWGYIYNHMHYKDGYPIYTSELVEVRDCQSRCYLEAFTRSGSRYRLYYRHCADVSYLEEYGVIKSTVHKIQTLAELC